MADVKLHDHPTTLDEAMELVRRVEEGDVLDPEDVANLALSYAVALLALDTLTEGVLAPKREPAPAA